MTQCSWSYVPWVRSHAPEVIALRALRRVVAMNVGIVVATPIRSPVRSRLTPAAHPAGHLLRRLTT
jgi:hypothetical protein